jgi:membrane protease YdiL (CAAX protease family)
MTFPATVRVPLDMQAVLYLLVMAVLMPIAAIRSGMAIAAENGRAGAAARTRILSRAVIVQLVLFAVSLAVARSHRMGLWRPVDVGPREIAVGVAALLVLLGVGVVSWRMRSVEERRELWVRHLVPRTRGQWALWLLVSVAAGISEETAYRGVVVVLLGSLTASFVIAALLSAAVFALVHYPQGGKSMVLVFATALVMQLLVSVTGTLYVAMGVHAAYDITAGVRAARELGDAS